MASGVVIGRHLPHEGLVVLVVEALHLPALAVVLVDGLLVQHGVRAAPVDLGERLVLGDIDDDHVVPADAAQAHVIGRVGIRRPVEGAARLVQHLVRREEAERIGRLLGAETAERLAATKR